jgi:hypothetical protein
MPFSILLTKLPEAEVLHWRRELSNDRDGIRNGKRKKRVEYFIQLSHPPSILLTLALSPFFSLFDVDMDLVKTLRFTNLTPSII